MQKPKTIIIACGALAQDIKQIQRLNSLNHMELVCLPAQLHNTPDLIVPALARKIADVQACQPEATLFIGYADCGTGGALDRLCAQTGIQRLPGAHCYQFYYGLDAFEQDADQHMRAFFLTDFLLHQFDVLVWQGLGLDKHPELRDMYFGHYESVIYLAQNPTPDKEKAAQRAADRLGLELEVRHTGYGALEPSLRQI